MAAPNIPICARCGFTTKNARMTDEGLLCSRCYSSYCEERAEYLAYDVWCY
ncbi:hypothetical protein [Methanolobus sp. ZRKC5]|uniref:hypothetical protein n=1 Tax=unclassified Methanolobus TaxID=2629569 RepID=UPI00313D61DD